MSRFGIFVISTGIFVSVFSSSIAQESKITVERIDPRKPVEDVLKDKSGSCAIVIQDGIVYRVCPFVITPEVQAAIKSKAVK
jgi:hypothetical protein